MPERVKVWGRIAVASRVARTPDGAFFLAWTRLLAGGLRPGDQVVDPPLGRPHHFAADQVADAFLKSACDSLLMIDDDMVFEDDAVERLRTDPAGEAFDILMGLCPVRVPPHLPVVLRRNPDASAALRYLPALEAIDGGVVETDMAGLAFTLIRRRVFEAVRPAVAGSYFQWGDVQQGEDAWFCEQARAAGMRIGVHTGVEIGHRVTVTVKWSAAKCRAVIAS